MICYKFTTSSLKAKKWPPPGPCWTVRLEINDRIMMLAFLPKDVKLEDFWNDVVLFEPTEIEKAAINYENQTYPKPFWLDVDYDPTYKDHHDEEQRSETSTGRSKKRKVGSKIATTTNDGTKQKRRKGTKAAAKDS